MLFTIFVVTFVLNFLMLDFSLLTDQLNLDNIINAFYDQYNRIKT